MKNKEYFSYYHNRKTFQTTVIMDDFFFFFSYYEIKIDKEMFKFYNEKVFFSVPAGPSRIAEGSWL